LLTRPALFLYPGLLPTPFFP